MQMPLPITRDVVLLGGGHAHALVLRMWAMNPLPGARLTLIDPQPVAAYTGMLPGFVAGHYRREELEIDLVPLARLAGARYIPARVTGIDAGTRTVSVEGRGPVSYDVASINIGVTADLAELPGFAEHGTPVRPLSRFATRWERFLDRISARGETPAIVLIGAGVGGVELALAIRHRLPGAAITIIERAAPMQNVTEKTRTVVRNRLRDGGIALLEGVSAVSIDAEAVTLDDGRELPAGLVIGTAGARPHGWLAGTGLPLENGFLVAGEDLSLPGHPEIFAVGDCAHLKGRERPKAGVFAVREAPVLLNNIRARLGAGKARPYRPQADYLKLISLGGKEALMDRSGVVATGRWLWRWKNSIDLKFMARLTDLSPMPSLPLPAERAEGMDRVVGDGQPICGGCGAKIGREALLPALARLAPPQRPEVESLPGDDAAILRIGGVGQVLTTDHLRAFTEDPHLFARITATHALGDIWAMGAAPQAGLLNVTLPPMSARLQDRTLAEIMEAVAAVLRAAGADIVGGHTSQGAEMSLGLTLTGLLDGPAKTLAGARPGDLLILTKPLGSGTILAAEMALKAPGPVVTACFETMCQPQGEAARILGQARAMTDVTGFGLAGHLLAMMDASAMRARLDLAAIPLLAGAEALAARGVASTLAPSNHASTAAMIRGLPQTPRAALLFDPQTAGGLLAASPVDVTPDLLAAGYDAAVIGSVYDGPPGIDVLA